MKFREKIFFTILLTIFLSSSNVYALNIIHNTTQKEKTLDNTAIENLIKNNENTQDIDPTVDLMISVKIKEIRALDKIDKFSNPDFYVKVIINDEEEITSGIWRNQMHVTEEWNTPFIDVPDEKEWVNVTIQLWDSDLILDKLCDIGGIDNYKRNSRSITIMYNLKIGHWFGDDKLTSPNSWSVDYSGYGRANGCDDGSIYEEDLDCELWFDIIQNDIDGDGIPYWTETEIFKTDPNFDDRGRDDDGDGIPIEWEYKWGQQIRYDHHQDSYVFYWEYDPFQYNDHINIDPDGDSINNYEEYLTSEYFSDPNRKDIFVELDQMQAGLNGEIESILPEGSKELIYKAFNRQNIVIHIDDGSLTNTGSEIIPFDDIGDDTHNEQCNQIYNEYFLHGNEENWRIGVFHYGIVMYNASFPGFCFRNNAFQISSKGMEKKVKLPFPITGSRDVIYASAYMHELGHSLGLTWLLGHDTNGYYPWQPLWWKARPYKSIMNYGYMYGAIWSLVDYSDGSRGKNDFDDWSNINFGYFEQ